MKNHANHNIGTACISPIVKLATDTHAGEISLPSLKRDDNNLFVLTCSGRMEIKMKKIISAVLCVALIMSFAAGCGSKASGSGSKAGKRILYNVKLSNYVTLGDYKDIPVDTSSDTFKEYYDKEISADVQANDFYVRKTEGAVAEGDTVNIDYQGKVDGVAFDGGTATDQSLVIGSKSFIDGFETGLIGVAIGSTVDLNLTFPENYQSTDLAGKAVVFTVKVNYVKTEEERKPEDYYSELKFEILKAYTDDVKERAIKAYLVAAVVKNSEIKSYPEDDMALLYDAVKAQYTSYYQSSYNMSFEDVLSYSGQTEDNFKTEMIDKSVKPQMDEQMVLYSILDKEKMKLTQDDTNAQIDDMVAEYNNASITAEKVKSYFGEYYFEYSAVNEKVKDYLYKNAKID